MRSRFNISTSLSKVYSHHVRLTSIASALYQSYRNHPRGILPVSYLVISSKSRPSPSRHTSDRMRDIDISMTLHYLFIAPILEVTVMRLFVASHISISPRARWISPSLTDESTKGGSTKCSPCSPDLFYPALQHFP